MSRAIDVRIGEEAGLVGPRSPLWRALEALGRLRPAVPRDLVAPLLAEKIVEGWRRREPRLLPVAIWPEALARVPGLGSRREVEAILRLLPPIRRAWTREGRPGRLLGLLRPGEGARLAASYARALRDLARERRWEPIEVADAFLLVGGRLLLERRPPTADSYAGLWDSPGGKLEPGESAAAALGRELREELGVEPLSVRGLGSVDHRDPSSDRIFRHRLFLLRRWRGEPRAREGQRLEWIGLRALRTFPELNPVVRRAVALVATGE